MPTNHRIAALNATERKFRDAALLLAWEQCLKENGLKGAMGCSHLAVEAANALVAERRNSIGVQP